MGRRRRGLMSEEFKYELAKDLGFYDTVMREGWEGIRTKDAGNLVKRAIQIAEQKLAKEYREQRGAARPYGTQTQPPQTSYASQPPGAAAKPSGYGYAGEQVPQQPLTYPTPSHAYSRQSGFTPLYPSYYGMPPAPPQEPAGGSQSYVN